MAIFHGTGFVRSNNSEITIEDSDVGEDLYETIDDLLEDAVYRRRQRKKVKSDSVYDPAEDSGKEDESNSKLLERCKRKNKANKQHYNAYKIGLKNFLCLDSF